MRPPLRLLNSLTATVVVAGGLALLVPSTAEAVTPTPGHTAIAGTATIAGTPSTDLEVSLYEVLPDGNIDHLGDLDTAADGTFFFDLTSGVASDGSTFSPVDPGVTSFKLRYYDDRSTTGDQLYAQTVYNGNEPTVDRAPAIPLPGAATVTTVPTISMSLLSGIRGTVSAPVPAGYYLEGNIAVYDADDNEVDYEYFDTDPGMTYPSTYFFNYLYPNQTYTLRAYAYAYPASGPGKEIEYVGQFYKAGSTFADATPVKVGPSGTITQPIDFSLTSTLTASEAPSIVGQVAPGKTLSVDPGTWSIRSDNEYSYQWLVNNAPVSTAPTFTVPKADLGKQVRAVVTTRVGDYIGTAPTEQVKVKYASKLKAKAKAVYVDGKRVVQIAGTLKVSGVKKNQKAKASNGKVVVYEGDVKVGKGKVKDGNLMVILKGITAGKHVLTVAFTGKKAADVVKTVKVKV